MRENPNEYTVGYYPQPFMHAPFVLSRHTNMVEALNEATMHAKLYYGEASPIILRKGRKVILTIPRGEGRALDGR